MVRTTQANHSFASLLRGSTVAALWTALLLAAGCSRFRTLKECNDVAAVVNPTLTTIAKLNEARPTSAQAYLHISQEYKKLATSLSAAHPRDATLASIVTEYGLLFEGAALTSQSYAEALRIRDASQTDMVKRVSAQNVKRERTLLRRFKTACAPGRR